MLRQAVPALLAARGCSSDGTSSALPIQNRCGMRSPPAPGSVWALPGCHPLASCFEDFFHRAACAGGASRNRRASSRSHGASRGKYWECGGAESHRGAASAFRSSIQLGVPWGRAPPWEWVGAQHSPLGPRRFQLASGALHVSGARGAVPRSGLKPLLGNHAPAFDLVSTHV